MKLHLRKISRQNFLPAAALLRHLISPILGKTQPMSFSLAQKTHRISHLLHGNGYQAIYGQLTDLDVAEGDSVEKGEIIGYVAAPTKYYSEEGSNLYFAMKKDGEPIDPIAYLP